MHLLRSQGLAVNDYGFALGGLGYTASSTFATNRVLSEHRFHSVTFVTSDYHMPRSYLLLKLMLMGKGVTIQRVTVKSPYFAGSSWPRSEKALKVTYAKGRGQRSDVGGQKPEEGDRSPEGGNPKDVPVFRKIRSWVLFGV